MLIILCCIKLINIWLAHYYRGQQEYNYKIKMYKLCENYVVVIIIGFIIVAHYMSMEAETDNINDHTNHNSSSLHIPNLITKWSKNPTLKFHSPLINP
jgi:hypothetical protein